MPENLPVISRPHDGAMLGGVCAGLARRWQLDPNLLRIAVVVLAVFGGLGLVAYGAGLLLMPRDGQAEMPVRRILPFTRSWSTGTVVVVTATAALLLVGIAGFNTVGFGPLVAIFLVWFFGFRGRNPRMPSAPPEPTPFERAADHWRHRLVEQQAPGYEDAALAAPSGHRWTQPYTDPASDRAVSDDDPPVLPTAPRPRRSWRLWWLALTLVGTAVLAVTLLGFAGLPATPLAYGAAVLGALGVTLLAATRGGRPPLLLPATLIAALATGGLMADSHDVAIPTVGERYYAYTSAADLPPSLNLGVGEMTVDLSRLQLSTDQTVDVHVGTGQLHLVLGPDVATEVVWTVRTGKFIDSGLPAGVKRDGFDIGGTEFYAARTPSAPTLHVRARVDLGEVQVQR